MAEEVSPRFRLVWTLTFLRTARKFLQRHPDLAGVFEDVVRQLEVDPYVRRLRIHALQGKHRGKHAVSLTYEHRIVFVFRISQHEIVLLDVGSHDQVYRA
jgi:mRNA-degrading endonuclease YafQ of YafQ-DinJ toxin-antitoxin module